MATLKLGKKPALHNMHTMRSALVLATVLDALGTPPPASNNYVAAARGVKWGMYLNDQLGDCVCVDTANTLMLRTANAAVKPVIPANADVLALYEAVGGYVPGNASTDNGCVEVNMLDHLQKVGFLGHKANATGVVNPFNLDHIKWCIQLFGSCRLGIQLPQFAMDQFEAQQPWRLTTSGDQTIIGGHDVPLVDYRGDNFVCITWAREQGIGADFLGRYCDEAHAELYFDWIREQGESPSGFDMDALVGKLPALS